MVSVVIPTRDRRSALAYTLDRLAAQVTAPDGWEVVVVDNGSTDGTADSARQRAPDFPVELRLVEELRPGPAAARNTGARVARGDVLLMLGDDMAPADEWLVASHAALHARRSANDYLVLGRATWRPDLPITDFMRWLENGGPQFQFHRLQPGPVDASRFLYTPNLSLKASLLRTLGGFDERFPYAALEDTELGTRLHDRGVTLDYHPELLVLHDHPTPLLASLGRMHRVGRAGAIFNAIHPHRCHPSAPVPSGWRWRTYAACRPPARLLARSRVPYRLRRRAWEVLHMAAYADGFREGPPPASALPGTQ